MKILVAEDDLVSLTALKNVLRRAGHEVLIATDGLEAWRCLHQPDAPQIAVLDWMMPGLDGPEICRRLRAQTPRPVVYLLLLTGKSDPEDLILGLKAGADDFLRKPFNPTELKARLEVGLRIVKLYNELAQNVSDLHTALRERKNTEERLRLSENHLRMVMNTVPAGVLVCDGQTGEITGSNPIAQQWLGLPEAELQGRTYHPFFQDVQGRAMAALPAGPAGADCLVVSAQGRASHIRLTQAEVRFLDRNLRLLSFLDISDTRRLLADQQLNLDQARKLLTIANAGVPRWLGINDDLTLHLAHYAASSQRAGGDHCWARTFPHRPARGPVTLIGLRDQSGHEVNCILRSIATDLFNKEAMEHAPELDLSGQLAWLNDRLCASGMFAEDDFVTALTLELDHATLQLRFVSCGHPPLFLIRQNSVLALPEEHGPGQNLPLGSLPGMAFESGQCQLIPGDRLVLFTDGLLELGKSARGAVLSVAEVGQILAGLVQSAPDLPVGALVRSLLDTANGAPGRNDLAAPPDDVTVLGLELEPDDGPGELVYHPAGLAELDQAIKQTWQRLTQAWHIESDASLPLRLLLDEAMTNAWRHGNQQNPQLPITVRWGQRNGGSLSVKDAGRGFDATHRPDPRSTNALLEESGRGLYLIRKSCEWAGWKKGGTRMVARLALPPNATPADLVGRAGI